MTSKFLQPSAFSELLKNPIFINANRTILKDGHLLPIPLIYDKIYPAEVFSGLRVGGKYILQAETCEDIEMPISVYECKHILREFGGLILNSVVMKQLEGERSMIFSLTRSDCKNIGIAYEPQLELLPMDFNWKPIKNKTDIPFDPKNMSTYEPSPKDGLYHQMHIIVRGTKILDSFSMSTPDNSIIDTNQFLSSIYFKFKSPALQRKFPITHKILFCDDSKRRIYDEKYDGIGFMLFFSATGGVDPKEFENKTIDELIEVSWVHGGERLVKGSTLKEKMFDDWYSGSKPTWSSSKVAYKIYPPL